jgi:hypothetical protein
MYYKHLLNVIENKMHSKEGVFFTTTSNKILSTITQQENALPAQFFIFEKCHENLIFSSIFLHQCVQCQSLFREFSWQCQHCELEESLLPVNNFQQEFVP